MITFQGKAAEFCDGVSRRDCIRVGWLAAGGLTLGGLLRMREAAAAQGRARRNTAVIFLELAGGPTQFETYDPKPDAPVEYRGPFQPIQTAIPGVAFSECMPQQAAIADQLVRRDAGGQFDYFQFALDPNLDQRTGRKIVEIMFGTAREMNAALVMVTHDLDLAAKTQRVLQLKGGKVVSDN